MTTLANEYRPRKFSEVVGQESELAVVVTMMKKGWKPAAIMLMGPFGTGKTTFARLIARAKLCDNPQYGPDQDPNDPDCGFPYEPCGTCTSCKAIDADNHPNYIEVDAASNGRIEDVREMKEHISYRAGSKITIICYDESHGLSNNAQNALLQTLEEGSANVLFLFATTEAGRMLPTINSRCVVLNLKLLKQAEIKERVLAVAKAENVEIEPAAAGLIATYVRGHVRDAMMLLEQLSRMSSTITSDQVRTYLRLDRFDEIYQLLAMKEKRDTVAALENLLCNHAPSDLCQSIGEVLLNAYKLKLEQEDEKKRPGWLDLPEADRAWLKRVLEARGADVLNQAEAVLRLPTDFASINYGISSLAKILVEDQAPARTGPSRGLTPGGAAAPVQQTFRKPGT